MIWSSLLQNQQENHQITSGPIPSSFCLITAVRVDQNICWYTNSLCSILLTHLYLITLRCDKNMWHRQDRPLPSNLEASSQHQMKRQLFLNWTERLKITYINYKDSTLLLTGVTEVKKTMLCGWRWLETLVYVCVTRVIGQTTVCLGKTLCLDQVTQWTLRHNLLLWACKRTPVFQYGTITAIVALSLTSPLAEQKDE